MDKIKENNKIKHLVKLTELSKSIVAKIQAIPELQELKFDLYIILYICDIIENNIKQSELYYKKFLVLRKKKTCRHIYTLNLHLHLAHSLQVC